ncbi:hypothetical protein CVD19_19780 [Bacillus sp. T33-2]|nr:hypothetical protein CVD19_19780 [Bacillus sp. T33-2]
MIHWERYKKDLDCPIKPDHSFVIDKSRQLATIAVNYYGANWILIVSICFWAVSLFSSIRIKTTKIKEAKKRPKWEVIKAGWYILFSNGSVNV